jgi:hypothetical protein
MLKDADDETSAMLFFRAATFDADFHLNLLGKVFGFKAYGECEGL